MMGYLLIIIKKYMMRYPSIVLGELPSIVQSTAPRATRSGATPRQNKQEDRSTLPFLSLCSRALAAKIHRREERLKAAMTARSGVVPLPVLSKSVAEKVADRRKKIQQQQQQQDDALFCLSSDKDSDYVSDFEDFSDGDVSDSASAPSYPPSRR